MAPPLVFDFLGVVFAAILYGIYCLIFGLYLRIQLKRTWKSVVFYGLTASFILCTAYFIILTIQVQFDITSFVLKDNSLESAVNWMAVANNGLYTTIDFISQLILLYRCWILWRQPLVMVIPCLLSLAFLATAWTTLGFQIKANANNLPQEPDWYESAVTAFFFISLGVNALVTAMIVYKIITAYNDIREFITSDVQGSVHGTGRRDLSPLISILIESGLITFVAQLTQAIMYENANAEFVLIGGSVVMLYGISSTVVLVRVELGISYDRNTAMTVNSATGRPVKLTPFTTKVNQTTNTDIERSDDPLDARSSSETPSRRKDIRPN